MKTLKDYQASEKAQTISEIAGANLDTTAYPFLSKPFCYLILKIEHGYYIKYEADYTLIESLKNGLYFVTVYKDDNYVDCVESVRENKIISL